MNNFTFFLVVFCWVSGGSSWRFFHNGRIKGGNLGSPQHRSLIKESRNFTRWFTQNLDHFDPTNRKTWEQRYYVNDEFFDRSKNTVFLMIGGEGEATDKWMTNGTWIDYARDFGALCFQLEHRFYGKSHPTEDLSTENLRYLTSEQALADLATFIYAMHEEFDLQPDVNWIAFGGSYPGSLAAWLRLKYPHLVRGSVSTSGPLLALTDFDEYYKVVGEDLRTISEDCYSAVKRGTAQVDSLLQHMTGQRTLTEMFKLCDPIEDSIENGNDISNFYDNLAGNFAGIAQYNKDNRIGQSPEKLNVTLDTLCGIMGNEQSNMLEITRLAQVNALILNMTNQTCTDYVYSKMIDEMRNISWDSESAEGGRQWFYQTCNEFGFYQTSSNKPQIFGDKFPVEFYIRQCAEVFGPNYNASYLEEGTKRTNTIYGALDIEVSNVVFVHGSVDPWHALGITKSYNENAPAIFIKGTAHCANMYPKSENDLPQLQAAREQIRQLISTWLKY
ncbi:putative serine protease F56F10.1 [Cylas formicarius]|uniref:putative serine protease F56F10.1 n=1 Tax=Cylas formicarius TaxID=197179 RepID=UPI002958BA94|nr:putative serine protease F56F10.1 [Cylas formicarius]